MLAPQISFINPTKPSGTITNNPYVPINVSISELNLNEVKLNWNGTNFTFIMIHCS